MSESIIKQKTFCFALEVIRMFRGLQEQKEYVLSKQVLRSGTSIGANVEEALAGQSRRDFLSKMSIASKEARETRYWLRLLQESQLVNQELAAKLLNEIEQIIRILTSIVKTTQENPRNSKLITQNS